MEKTKEVLINLTAYDKQLGTLNKLLSDDVLDDAASRIEDPLEDVGLILYDVENEVEEILQSIEVTYE